MKPNKNFWQGKKVFLTGHSGFKGSWMALLLHHLGAQVSGYSLKPHTKPSLYQAAKVKGILQQNTFADLGDLKRLSAALKKSKAEIVLHMAAQPIVVQSFKDPEETFASNVMGTFNLLEACRQTKSVRSVLVVTSDKCYENYGNKNLKETDALGGSDPYSASKACTEIVARSMGESFFYPKNIALNTVRAGNIIGGGDWGEFRLIPDIVRAVFAKKPLVVRMPKATRPWQHVLDALIGYLLVAEKMSASSASPSFEAWNFGPTDKTALTVGDLLERAKQHFENLKWRLEPMEGVKEAPLLALDSSKARSLLRWTPHLSLDQAVQQTWAWYEKYYEKNNAADLCAAEIDRALD